MPRPVTDDVRILRRYEACGIGLLFTYKIPPSVYMGTVCRPSTKFIELVWRVEVLRVFVVSELVCRLFVYILTEDSVDAFSKTYEA